MALTCRWGAGCVSLWTFVVFTPWTSGQEMQDKSELYLSVEDVLLLKDEPNPKCFSQTWDGVAKDFACFFQTRDDSDYDFYYTTDNPPRRTRCEMSIQKSEDSTFLHICSFPHTDIFLFDEIPLEVLDRTKNTSLYSRTVTVEDNILLEQPRNITVTQNDNVGELQVSWQAKCAFYQYHKIRYSSKTLSAKIKQGHNKFSDTLVGLVPGEEYTVQVSVRCAPSRTTGHWSHWSDPVRAVVPQTADDVALMCYTRDLFNITCRWDSRKYNMETDYALFYKMGWSEGMGRTQWSECPAEINLTDRCRFHGNTHKKVRLKLSSPSAPLNRTFYSQDFSPSSIIQTSPPTHLRQNETDAMCMNWESPLPSLAAHLQYEVSYRVSGEKQWMTVSTNGPETAVCLKLPWGSLTDVKVHAKPRGPRYSGHWSEWSDVLRLEVLAHSSSSTMLLLQCSPILLLVLFIPLFSRHFGKLKQHFWPPVPNLDKVLQEFMSDLNQQKWDPLVRAKPCYEETTASIVEVLSKDYDPALEEASQRSAELLSSSDTSYSSVEQEDESMEMELYPDYVALNRHSIIFCSKENSYIYEDHMENRDEENIPASLDDSLPRGHCLGSDFLNHSYLILATDSVHSKDGDQKGHGNIYTNLPCN